MSNTFTSTGHIIPGIANDLLTEDTLNKALYAVNDALTVPDGTLTLRQITVLDRRRQAIKAELDRRS